MNDMREQSTLAGHAIREAKNRLVSCFGYPERTAEQVAGRLERSDDRIRCLLERWLDDGDPDQTYDVHGYTVRRLVDGCGLNPIAALTTLDWIRREPERAIRVVTRHDTVLPRRGG